jgi:hypothetical protein
MKDMLNFFTEFRFHLIIILLLCFAHGLVRAEEKTAPLPADAQKAVTACDLAIAKARSDLLKNLKLSLTKATKAGDLPSANLVQARIVETEKLLAEGIDLLGNKKETPYTFQGSYKITTPAWRGVWSLQDGGKCSGDSVTGTWTADKGGKITLRWSSGHTEYLQAVKEETGVVFTCELSSGVLGTAVRL